MFRGRCMPGFPRHEPWEPAGLSVHRIAIGPRQKYYAGQLRRCTRKFCRQDHDHESWGDPRTMASWSRSRRSGLDTLSHFWMECGGNFPGMDRPSESALLPSHPRKETFVSVILRATFFFWVCTFVTSSSLIAQSGWYSPCAASDELNTVFVCRQKVPDTFGAEVMCGLSVCCGCDPSPLCFRL
jgi:hypothetical protein